MSKPPELSLDGFTIHTLLGRRTYRWSWIYYYWPWPRRLELLLDAPELGRMGAVPAIHRDHVPEMLRYPSFPRWLFSTRRAMQYGLSQTEAEAYGPPSDTRWTRGSVPGGASWNAEVVAEDGLRTGFEFSLFVDRVGTFREGVVFAFQDDVRVVPWDHVGIDSKTNWEELRSKATPSLGPCARFGLIDHNSKSKAPEFGADQFFATLEQACAVLSVPEANEVRVPPGLAKTLGLR